MEAVFKEYNSVRNTKSNVLCHAPFASLRFTLSGNIQACCFNRLFIVGKYPENKLIDVWKGEKLNRLKESINKKDFSYGCGYCLENFLSKNYYSVGAKNYDYLNFECSQWPVMLDFELGNNCNLECIMCNGENSNLIRKNREKQEPYSVPYNDDFVEQLKEFIPQLKEARFVGGEPFLIEINYKIWETILKLNPSCAITILTNGTVLNDRIKKLITKGNFNISVSSDGISKSVYEKIRINADYEIFRSNLSFFTSFAKKQKKPFFMNLCPMRYNWNDIPGYFDFCNTNNLYVILHSVLFPPSSALWNLPKNELEKIHNFIKSSRPGFKKSSKAHIHNLKVYDSLLTQLQSWVKKPVPATSSTSIDELKTKFNNKISNYLKKSALYPAESKSKLLDKYIRSVDSALKQVNKKDTVKVLSTLNYINIEFLIGEIENSTQEKLNERIKSFTD